MKTRNIIIIFILLILLTGGFIVFQRQRNFESSKKTYTTYLTHKSDFEKIVEADGVVEARDTKLVYVDTELRVNKLYYEEGDYVKKGEVIMTFDPEDKNKVIRELKKEEINLKKLKRNLKNTQELLGAGGASKVDVEDIQYDIEESLLSIEEYKEEESKMMDEIKSPFDGTIVSMIAEENYRVNTESELFEIADLSDIVVIADVPEYSIKGVAIGQKARVSPEAYDEAFDGTISEISTLSTATDDDNSSSDSTEAYVEVKINLEKIPQELRPGFNAKVEIVPSTSEDTISVPRTAVLGDGEKYYVLKLQSDDTVVKHYVRLGKSNSGMMEIIDIDENVMILKDPDQSLEENDKVKIQGIVKNDLSKKSGEGARS